jgi:hypothetical protein
MEISLKWIELVNIETVSLSNREINTWRLKLKSRRIQNNLYLIYQQRKSVFFSLEIAALLNKPSQISDYSLQDKNGITKLKNFLRVFLLKVLVRHCYQSLLKT